VQLTVHEGVVTRGEMIDWVREAAAKELGLASPATTGAALRRVR
jgi:hypothetical protein